MEMRAAIVAGTFESYAAEVRARQASKP
jgi:hypothetical protein